MKWSLLIFSFSLLIGVSSANDLNRFNQFWVLKDSVDRIEGCHENFNLSVSASEPNRFYLNFHDNDQTGSTQFSYLLGERIVNSTRVVSKYTDNSIMIESYQKRFLSRQYNKLISTLVMNLELDGFLAKSLVIEQSSEKQEKLVCHYQLAYPERQVPATRCALTVNQEKIAECHFNQLGASESCRFEDVVTLLEDHNAGGREAKIEVKLSQINLTRKAREIINNSTNYTIEYVIQEKWIEIESNNSVGVLWYNANPRDMKLNYSPISGENPNLYPLAQHDVKVLCDLD